MGAGKEWTKVLLKPAGPLADARGSVTVCRRRAALAEARGDQSIYS